MKPAPFSIPCFIVLFTAILLGLAVFGSSDLQAQATEKEETVVADIGTAPDQAAIDNLQKFLVGSKWKGTFTMKNREGMLEPEAYEIVSAKKEPKGDNWVLVSRIKYMKRDVKVPVPLSIMWLDRTPVIVLDQITIPGMGTFDARVIIRKGMYAGTWAHGEMGGHMFGDITKAEQKSEKGAAKNEEDVKDADDGKTPSAASSK